MKKFNLIFLFFFVLCLTSTNFLFAQNANTPIFYITSDKTTVAAGEEFKIKIKTKNFTNILTFQWGMKWILDDFEFVSLNAVDLPLSGPISVHYNLVQPNNFLTAWFLNTLTPVTLPEASTIYEMTLRAKQGANVKNICFDEKQILMEVSNNDGVVLETYFYGLDCAFFLSQDKVVKPIVLADKEVSELDATIFPNPASDFLQIKFNDVAEIDNCEVKIYDLIGKLVMQQPLKVDGKKGFIPIQSLTNGTYFYQITNEKGKKQGNFVKI